MAEIPLVDYKLPDHILKALNPLACAELKLPDPQTLNLCSPFGGAKFQGIVDVTQRIPDDCSLVFSILLQLPPFLVSLGCFVKVLKVFEPLLKFVNAVKSGDLIEIGKAVPALVEALGEVVACFVNLVAGVPMFIKDLLLLIAKFLKCIAKMILSLVEMISGLTISIKAADAAGNKELLKQLECAKDNADAQAKAAKGSVDVIAVILAMAEPLMALMPGAPKIAIPSFEAGDDVFAIEQSANTMLSVATSLETIAKSLPSC
jgi:hypothetical protein